jgi:hypothetical protein
MQMEGVLFREEKERTMQGGICARHRSIARRAPDRGGGRTTHQGRNRGDPRTVRQAAAHSGPVPAARRQPSGPPFDGCGCVMGHGSAAGVAFLLLGANVKKSQRMEEVTR